MNYLTVSRRSESARPRLILIFAGWGMDGRPFAGLGRDGYDTAVVWDYADARPLPLDLIAHYREICVMAWSFGVPYAARFIAAHAATLPITRCVAVNGTLHPVDDHRGIPEVIFRGTLDNLDARNLTKFQRRMTGGGDTYARFAANYPQRTIDSLADELRRVAADGAAPDPCFDSVYISGADRIIPPAGQRKAWEGHENITELGDDAPHMPDFAAIIEHEFADKHRISRSFGEVAATYDEEAEVQREAAECLAGIWSAAVPPTACAIEFGTGTGLLSRLIANPLARYDIAPLFDDVRCSDAEVDIADMIAAESKAGPIAGVVAASTIQWFNSPRRFLARALRAMPSGAVLALSSFGPDTYRELKPFQRRRPTYLSAAELQKIAQDLVDQGLARKDFTVKEMEPRVIDFGSTRALTAHIRRSGVNATQTPDLAAARALLASGITTLTYTPVFIALTRV